MKKAGVQIRLLLMGGIALLWLFSLGIMLVWEAREIRDRMEACVENGFVAADQRVQAVSDQEKTGRSDYLLAMEGQENTDYLEYPAISATVLLDRKGNRLCSSPNVIVATMTRETGEPVIVPMFFPNENSADAAEILQLVDLRGGISDDSRVIFTGYRLGDVFYLTEVNDHGMLYLSGTNQPLPEGAVEMRYDISSSYRDSNFRGLTTKIKMKPFGDSTMVTLDYASEWKRTDQLVRQLADDTEALEPADVTYLEKGLFTCVMSGRRWVYANENPFGATGPMVLVYGVEFHPMELAMRECMHSGSFVLLLLPFLAMMILLPLFCENRRRKELRPLQDELARQQQVIDYARDAEASRRAMTSAIAHELKTPIAVMSSYAQALQEHIDESKQEHYLSVIREEADKMDRMVLELLDFSRLEAGRYKLRRQDFNLTELVREILKPLEPEIAEKHLDISWQIGEEKANGDRFRFGQVVENYLTNAIRHTPENGKIILRIGMNHETFSVENQGEHIPQENIKKVWETFWQGDAARNTRGSGLGLAICRTIMTLHGGSCKAENTGMGVRFTATLDAAKPVFRSYFRPLEQVAVQYPISQSYTTVENVMRRLGLLEGTALKREIRAGNLKIGGKTVSSPNQRVYPGNELSWQELSVYIVLDESEKHYRLLYEQIRTGGIGDAKRGMPMSGAPKM